jgi:hypothetical protein
MSESVTILVASLYAEAIEAIELRAALSASAYEKFRFWVILVMRRGFETDPNLLIFQ